MSTGSRQGGLRRAGAAACVVAVGVAACGDDERVGGTLDTGLKGSKPLNELTADEIRAFCEAAVEYGNRLLAPELVLRASCILSTFLSATEPITASECRSRVDECVARGAVASAQPDACDVLATTQTTCTATVSVFEYCVAATAKVSSGFLEELSCDLASASAEDLAELYRRYDLPPPECDALVAVCPELVVGSSI